MVHRLREAIPGMGNYHLSIFRGFGGENPKLWQTRWEDYFDMFDTDPDLWIAVAAMQFEGPTARWLSSVQHKFVRSP